MTTFTLEYQVTNAHDETIARRTIEINTEDILDGDFEGLDQEEMEEQVLSQLHEIVQIDFEESFSATVDEDVAETCAKQLVALIKPKVA